MGHKGRDPWLETLRKGFIVVPMPHNRRLQRCGWGLHGSYGHKGRLRGIDKHD